MRVGWRWICKLRRVCGFGWSVTVEWAAGDGRAKGSESVYWHVRASFVIISCGCKFIYTF